MVVVDVMIDVLERTSKFKTATLDFSRGNDAAEALDVQGRALTIILKTHYISPVRQRFLHGKTILAALKDQE